MSEMKDDLRIFLKQARANLSKQRREQANVKIMDELLGHLAPYDYVLSFASMGDEIDLWELNEALAKQGRLLLPRMEGDLLVPQPVSDLKKLEKSKYKIFEPKAGAVAKKI
ncbi:MAG: 5-formyltetrahydrofolate cyclo-ligase, partial [Simkaniaceae bacterium]|nr:5-formyltetrahydrofolate cyclo-ligase [Simkaniaceae bacterium]